MSLEQDVSKGNKAERILSDLSPYFDTVEAAILNKWATSPIADLNGQHELRLMIKLLGDVKANLKTAIDTGKLAKVTIERDNLIDKAKNAVRRFA